MAVVLVLAGPCPRAAGDRPHTWQEGDYAELVSYGQPDHAISVRLGRCSYCTAPLLRLQPLAEDSDPDGGPTYEARGAEL